MPEERASYFQVSQVQDSEGRLESGFLSVTAIVLPAPPPDLQSSLLFVQIGILPNPKPNYQVGKVITQYAQVAPEDSMVDFTYPQLIGLSWSTGMTPTFSTKIATHTSGKESRTAYWQDPIWEFNLKYDYLPNKEAGVTDLKKLMGFFLTCQGSFENFLFKAPDFYQAINQDLLTGDGNTVEVTLTADINNYEMPIGYLNVGTQVIRLEQLVESHVINGAGNISLTYHTNAIPTDVAIGSTHLTEVPDATPPGANEYNFAEIAGTMHFNAARIGQTVQVSYGGELVIEDDYTILLPNTIVLSTAPPVGSLLVGTYQYFFVCRFMDDRAEFEQFMDKLWELQEVNFRSDPL